MTTRHLRSDILPVPELGRDQARALFGLFSRHYENVSWELFESDLLEKDHVILLREEGTGAVRGFSTQKILRARVGGRAVRAIFSGDTIIDPAYWGEQELVRAWCRFAGRVLAQEPGTRLFWFLICKGYRTYLYLPLFFREHFPRHDAPTPAFEKEAMDSLAAGKFPGSYDPARGLLRFERPHGNLAPALAEVPAGRRSDPRVRFFLERNARYREGDELVCLAEVSEANMKGLALRMCREGLAAGPLVAPREALA